MPEFLLSDFAMPIKSGFKKLGTITFAATPEIRGRAVDNHGQTLERLRERGGLSWMELYCVLFNKGLDQVSHSEGAQHQARVYLLNTLHYKWEPHEA